MAQKIPLALRLKRESHRKIAAAQDLIVREIYAVFDTAVFHGGTAIWRCYSGKRFSEDLDFYIPKETAKINALFDRLEKKGFKVIKRKISENSVYSEFELDRVTVRFEATFQKIKGHLLDYENVDGTYNGVYSLTHEEFITEKVNAYLTRRKIRDLYDIYFLTSTVNDYSMAAGAVRKLIANYQPPLDEQDLKAILLEGIIPKSKEIIEYLKRKWQNT